MCLRLPAVAIFLGLSLSSYSHGDVFLVTSTSDSGGGSLRQAIVDANASSAPSHEIRFQIPASDPGYDSWLGVFLIEPTSGLPLIRNDVTLDGTTQTAFTGDTNLLGPEVVLDGSQAGGASGVLISGDNNTIRSLIISGFVTGIEITYSPDRTSSNNRLEQNYIGTDSAGTSAVANAGNGILIRGFGSPCCQAADNVVEENLISGNRQNGLLLCDAARTLIAGNLIGTDITGLADLGNGGNGIATVCAGSPPTIWRRTPLPTTA